MVPRTDVRGDGLDGDGDDGFDTKIAKFGTKTHGVHVTLQPGARAFAAESAASSEQILCSRSTIHMLLRASRVRFVPSCRTSVVIRLLPDIAHMARNAAVAATSTNTIPQPMANPVRSSR